MAGIAGVAEFLLYISLKFGAPLLLAAIGEIFAERSGILNLGVEGIIMFGAAVSFATGVVTGNPLLALLVGGLAGATLSLLHAFVSISLRGNQTVSGLAVTMVGVGLSSLVGSRYVGVPLPYIVEDIPLGPLASIPVIGALFRQDPVVYFALVFAFVSWFILFRTRVGIEIRAVGESPITADSAGVNVELVRYSCTIFGGFMAGIAGAYYSTIFLRMWVENLTLGKGWIALALVILALWDPVKALLFSVAFGFVDALQLALQMYMNTYILGTFPYLTSIAILTVVIALKRGKGFLGPAALSRPYIREEEALHGV